MNDQYFHTSTSPPFNVCTFYICAIHPKSDGYQDKHWLNTFMKLKVKNGIIPAFDITTVEASVTTSVILIPC